MTDESVGMRFTTLIEHKSLVDDYYKNSGFSPMRVEENSDGTVTFIFKKMPLKQLEKLVNVVPHKYSAIQGFTS